METSVILQWETKPSDNKWNWEYTNPVLEKLREFPNTNPIRSPKESNRIIIKSIQVSNENIKLSKIHLPASRLTKCDVEEHLIHISFKNLKFPDTRHRRGSDLTDQYIERLLLTGIYLNSVHYAFYGHSNSQLQSRSCYLRKQLGLENHDDGNFLRIAQCGDFHNINSVSKRVKRIGLLFSATEFMTQDFDEKSYKIIKDIEGNNKSFSDGCGYIKQTSATQITQLVKIPMEKQLNRKIFTPSVFQVRFKGFKGVLVSIPDEEIRRILKLTKSKWYTPAVNLIMNLKPLRFFKPLEQNLSPSILFPNSMKKFENCFDNMTFCVMGYSRPFTYGKLNGELITLLSTQGIAQKLFEDRLRSHLHLVQHCKTNIHDARELAISKSNFPLVTELSNLIRKNATTFTDDLATRVLRMQKEEELAFYDDDYEKNKVKVQILVYDSRLLFGVCDFSGKLKEGQCFVRYSELAENEKMQNRWTEVRNLKGKIIVGRNPCLHPGDIQTFEAVDEKSVPELSHLCDCIVFSVKGSTPPASLLSGGDLDGDLYFVCWDKQLIPNRTYPPLDYLNLHPTPKETSDKITQNDMIHYFSHFNRFSLGRIKNIYLKWARALPDKIAASSQCIQLNELFSKCVDGETVEIPLELRNPPEPITNPPFILDVLEKQIRKVIPHSPDDLIDTEIEVGEEVVELGAIASTKRFCIKSWHILKKMHDWFQKFCMFFYIMLMIVLKCQKVDTHSSNISNCQNTMIGFIIFIILCSIVIKVISLL